jgi:hypothetical protein
MFGLELIQLRKLPPLAFRLFVELAAMADFATGRIETTYALLHGLLDFDQSPCAHTITKPTTKRIRTALQQLVTLRLVNVDRITNAKRQSLFLRLPARHSISLSNEKKGRLRGRVQNGGEQATARLSKGPHPHEGQTEGQWVQEKNSPPSPSLSTASRAAVRAQLDAVKQQLTARRGKPSK